MIPVNSHHLPTRQQQAADKRVPILVVAEALGLKTEYVARGGNYYMKAPWREETTPSLILCQPKNCWKDFGDLDAGEHGSGGDVLALIMRFFDLTLPQARQVLRELLRHVPAEAPRPAPEVHAEVSGTGLTFCDVEVTPLTHHVLLQYLSVRKINWALICRNPVTLKYLQQVTYRLASNTRDKPFFALAWRTEKGIEIRNARFQNCMGSKSVTYIEGQEDSVAVFEGFMDYLSALTHYNVPYFRSSVLVLNGSTRDLLQHAVERVRTATHVRWFGDNDAAGEKALAYFRRELPAGTVFTCNEVYRGYKDFNDLLTRTPPKRALPLRRAEPSYQSKTAKWWLWVVFDEVDPARSRQNGHTEYKQCTYYSYCNEASGLEALLVLRNRLQWSLRYYRLCERTVGRDFKILAFEGCPTKEREPAHAERADQN